MNDQTIKLMMIFGKNYFFRGRKYSRFADDGRTPLHYEVPKWLARELMSLKTIRGIPYFTVVLDDDEAPVRDEFNLLPPVPAKPRGPQTVKVPDERASTEVDLAQEDDPLADALDEVPVATSAVVTVAGDEGEEV